MLSVGIKTLSRKYAKYLHVKVLLPMRRFEGGVRQVFVGISLLNNGYMESEMAQKFSLAEIQHTPSRTQYMSIKFRSSVHQILKDDTYLTMMRRHCIRTVKRKVVRSYRRG